MVQGTRIFQVTMLPQQPVLHDAVLPSLKRPMAFSVMHSPEERLVLPGSTTKNRAVFVLPTVMLSTGLSTPLLCAITVPDPGIHLGTSLPVTSPEVLASTWPVLV